MLWCKDTFEQQFDEKECRLFALQQQLFAFVDDAATCQGGDAWLCFSIEFPSSSEVSRLLSRHSFNGREVSLFKTRCTVAAPQSNTARPHKRPREDFSLLYGDAPLSQQNRMFLASTPAGIQKILAMIEPRQLHLYEIIREGTPCHLYFDVEREGNYAGLRAAVCVDDDSSSSSSSSVIGVDESMVYVEETGASGRRCTTFQVTASRYRNLCRRSTGTPPGMCGLDCSVEPDNTRTCDILLRELEKFVHLRFPSLASPQIESDGGSEAPTFEEVWVLQSVPLSGASAKFSQHYVIKFHNTVFDSTNSVKAFVRQFVAYLHACAIQHCSIHESLFFHGSPVWCAVLDKLSTDYPRNTLPYLPRRCVVDEAVYSKNRMMRCIGSCKLGKTSVLRVHEHHLRGRRGNTAATAPSAPPSLDVFLSTLIAQRLSAASPARSFHVAGDTSDSGGCPQTTFSPSAARVNAVLWKDVDCKDDGAIEQLAPLLQRAYARISRADCSVWRPRQLRDRFLTFQVRGTRYCQRVGREHKSNNVYLVVDVEKRTFVQKCFDPDCSSYRSQPFSLDDIAKDTSSVSVGHDGFALH